MTSERAWWRLKSPASRLLTQPFVQAQTKENIKDVRHSPLLGEFTGDRWISHTKYHNAEMFLFDDVIMILITVLYFSWMLEKSVTNSCVKYFFDIHLKFYAYNNVASQ